MRIDSFPIEQAITLKPIGTWPKAAHHFTEAQVVAVVAAWHARRPLLVRGEPGVGKTQLARAVAQHMGYALIPVVVQPRDGYQALLWQFDAVARLGKAQMLGALAGTQAAATESVKPATRAELVEQLAEELAEHKYIKPGPLWWAYRPISSAIAAGGEKHSPALNTKNSGGCVLLIDEIDKADADLPNGLLELFANGDFELPPSMVALGKEEKVCQPLVLITSNAERELPPAFMRRCLVLDLRLPDAEQEPQQLVDYLIEVAEASAAQGGDTQLANVEPEVLQTAAERILEARQNSAGQRPPGVAEFLDLLRVIGGMANGVSAQLAALESVAGLVLEKHSESAER